MRHISIPPTGEEIEIAIQEAERLPKLDPESLTPEEQATSEGPYKNNFYLLFDAMLRREEGDLAKGSLKRLEIAEAYGDKWRKFLAENQELVNEILAILRDHKIYDELLDLYKRMCRHCSDKELDTYDQNASLDQIRTSIFYRLNPLLQQVLAAMKDLGIEIDPKSHHSQNAL